MRGKVAKRLRKAARAMHRSGTVNAVYEEISHTKTIMIPDIDEHGVTTEKPVTLQLGTQRVLQLGCGRGIYQDLKQMHKDGGKYAI